MNKSKLYTLKKHINAMERICKICGTVFDVWPSYVKRGGGIYCSRKCKDKAQSIRMKNAPPEKGIRWKGGLVEQKCLNCGKTIKVKQCLIEKQHFCSNYCAGTYNSIGKERKGVILKCKVCGKEFYRVQSAVNRKTKKPQFCSQKCRAIHSVRNQRKKDTNIERILEKWLISNKIRFKKQEAIKGIALVDFFIEPNICLFADGDYWHSLPKRKILDKRQTGELIQEGYHVVRILGSELLNGKYPNEIL